MTKLFVMCIAAIFCVTPLMAAQNNASDTGPWSGRIVNSTCTPEQGFNEAAECVAVVPDAKLALYDDTSRKIYSNT